MGGKAMGSEVHHFLETLFVGKPDDLYILIWTLADKRSYWFQKVDEAIQFVESLALQDVYVGTGLSAHDHGPFHRCKSDEIAGSVGVFVDIDLRSDAHPNTSLPSTVEEALSILPPEFPPTFVILTGNGIHAWFLFPEPYIFENDEDRKNAAALAKQWNTLIRDNGSMKGWKIDRLGDLARVLRIAGTMNCKDPANPKSVIIHTRSDRRYNPSDLAEHLDDLGVADEDASETAARQWAQQFQDNPLKIDLDVTIPQEQLDRWFASDSRFRQTWFRQRPDLKDQSQSAYDMSLTNFGVRLGLAAQQIVDLIVYHRRIYKQQRRTKPDYFHRTIAKARQQPQVVDESGPAPEPAPFAEFQPATPEQSSAPLNQAPKSDREKIQLCKTISTILGVEVLRILKLSGENPLYRLDLSEGAIELPAVGKLMNQKFVRESIAARVGKILPRRNAKMWEELVQMMLDACIVEDGGEELESQGAARLLIGQYLGETAFISCMEGQSPQDLRKPMVRDDQISVCSSDFHFYVNKTRPSQAISLREAAGMLSVVGAKVARVRGKKFKEQSRWMLPLADFDPADYASSVSGGSIEHG